MPPDLISRQGGQVWITTKVLRHLAWHKRSGLRVLHHLAAIGAEQVEAG